MFIVRHCFPYIKGIKETKKKGKKKKKEQKKRTGRKRRGGGGLVGTPRLLISITSPIIIFSTFQPLWYPSLLSLYSLIFK